jgi:NADPH:quinone reductase-like Zn-dependent oxidoreductase
MSFATAAAIPQAAVIALQALRGRVRADQSVLLNGAGGGAGTFAIQLARSYGAEVTAVDHGDKLDLLRSLGADHVVDYTREDCTRGPRRYDWILDVVAHRSPLAWARALRPGGSYFAAGGAVATFLQILLVGPWLRWVRSRSVRTSSITKAASPNSSST